MSSSTTRQRKTEETSKEIKETDDDHNKQLKRHSSFLQNCFKGSFFVILAVCLTALVSLFITGTSYTFHYPIPNLRRYLPTQSTLRVFTPDELLQYNGEDDTKPIYIGILGDVFDVTKGKRFYGKGSGYHVFAGRDASRAFITGCFQTHLTHDLRGLTEGQITALHEWREFYKNHKEYFQVGTVALPHIDPHSPVPEPCQHETKPE